MSPPRNPLAHRLAHPVALGALSLVLVAALLVSLVAATGIGAAAVPFDRALRFVWAALTGGTIGADEVTHYQIVWQVRAPRALLAALVGACLSATGAVIQAMVRNVLADPFVLGISSGASVGAVTTTILLGGMSTLSLAALVSSLHTTIVVAGAFVGALAASALVWSASWRRDTGVTPIRLVLTGVVLAAGFQAVMSVLIFLVPDTESTATVLFWSMGSFGAASWALLPPVAVVIIASLVVYATRATVLDVLSLGDESAASLGVNATRSRGLLFATASIATAAATAVSGAVGFVGLIMPHLVRMLVGASHRRVLLVSPLVGALFMVWVDVATRTLVAPRELPLSAITALFGVPVFILLLRRRGSVLGAR